MVGFGVDLAKQQGILVFSRPYHLCTGYISTHLNPTPATTKIMGRAFTARITASLFKDIGVDVCVHHPPNLSRTSRRSLIFSLSSHLRKPHTGSFGSRRGLIHVLILFHVIRDCTKTYNSDPSDQWFQSRLHQLKHQHQWSGASLSRPFGTIWMMYQDGRIHGTEAWGHLSCRTSETMDENRPARPVSATCDTIRQHLNK